MVPLPTTVQVSPEHAGKRVERVLLKALPGLRESFLLMLLHRGKVLLDGRALRRGERLPDSGRLEVLPPDPKVGPQGPVPNTRINLKVLHADEDVIVVAKPSGLAMQPGPQHGSNTLQNALVARYPDLIALGARRGFGLVSRLDLGVSGLVVVARSARAYEGLVGAFTAREVEKGYRALVLGAPSTAKGTVDTPVAGLEARTEWELLEQVDAGGSIVALLALHPLTGRKHQLRVHMASLGRPILGDAQHGSASLPIARELGLRRIALHAGTLAFRHPVTGARLFFEAPWPPDLELVWERARTGRRPDRARARRRKRRKSRK
ncbi:MAG TPA: RluA family pseudouridine synthase [Planctomycetota bacterium]|nr:RluA family pseudouridine synthase [Planctomycetota bacterium]